MDRQDQPKIYIIRDHTLEVLMHPDVLELHAARVVSGSWSGYDGVDVRERPVPKPSVHFSKGG